MEDGTQPARRRLGNSCECCHKRKVRCDVNSHGQPCTNCQLDGRQCVLRAPLKRGRKSRAHNQDTPAAPSARSREILTDPVRPNTTQNTPDDASAAILDAPSTTTSFADLPQCHPRPGVPAQVYVPFYYFKYLEVPDMNHLSPMQIRALEQGLCLSVPSHEVLDEFVRQYFLYVHPGLPILDEGSFWSMYSRQAHAEPSTCSLVLFQAMLFASSRFVPMSIIEACGFRNLKHARAEFRRRTELLLQHGLERNNIALAQASLLLSLHATMSDQKLNSLWLSKAITHAKAAGANHYFHENNENHRLRLKRLWWSCIIRDAMIVLGVRRKNQIGPEDFDFDQEGLEEEDLAGEHGKSNVYDIRSKKTLSRIFVAQCALAVAIIPITDVAHRDESTTRTQETTVASLLSSMTAVQKATTELSVWARRFRLALTNIASAVDHEEDLNPSLTLFAHMTMIYYHSAHIALCNCQVSILQRYHDQLDDYGSRISRLCEALQGNIARITEMITDLSDKGLVHHLPTSAPPCAALPFLLEMINFRLSSSTQKQAHQQRLDYYNRTMTLFRAQHDHAECVSTAIDTVLHVAEPEINDLVVTRYSSQSSARLAGWSDIFAENPLFYLRLSLSLDSALSLGKAPMFTDLPMWVMGSSTDSFLPALPMSLDWMLPWEQQATTYDTDELRFIEINEDDEDVDDGQWLNDEITNYGIVMPQ